MSKSFKAVALCLSLLLANVSVCSAQDFDKGLAAAQKGDFATALREWLPLAGQGNVGAQYNLGVMYENGQGVAKDYKEAVRLYRLAAAQDSFEAQFNLGRMYDVGHGVTQDYKEAVRLYKLAAAQSFAGAQNNLGVKYDNGQGVTKDYEEAARLYGLAAAQGYAAAQNNLGVMYQKGQGVIQDYKEAARLYRLAAAQGYAIAQNNLGAMKLVVERKKLSTVGPIIGRFVAIFLFQLLLTVPLYFISRKYLSAGVTTLIMFLIAFGVGLWSDSRIISNTCASSDHLRQMRA